MDDTRYPYMQFTTQDIADTSPALKVGILATVTGEGYPHLTMISTLRGCASRVVCWGAFTEGMSKKHIRANPKTAFLIMSLDKHFWRGQADFTHTAKDGPEHDLYNQTPMFRYNAYFGVHTVYYMDLVHHNGKQALPMNRIILAAVKTMAARSLARKPAYARVMNPWTTAFYNKMDNLKFISWIGEGGYPEILPVIQAQALDPAHILFAGGAFQSELERIPDGCTAAVFGMALTMEDVLVRGQFHQMRRTGGIRCGLVDVDWVYNPMPPAPAQVYPPLPLEAVREF